VTNQRQEHQARGNASSKGDSIPVSPERISPASTGLLERGERCEPLRKKAGSSTEPPGRKKGSCATATRKELEAKQNNQGGKRKGERLLSSKINKTAAE
jgi:hypothetical protein